MSVANIIARCAELGINIEANADSLIATPASKLTDDLRAELRAYKQALVPYLQGRGCGGCGVLGAALDPEHGRCTACYIAARKPSGCDICSNLRPIMLVGNDGSRVCSLCFRGGR